MRSIAVDGVDRLAPPSPACFESRDIWLQFLASADAVKDNAGGPQPFINGAWNPHFHPCTDCTREFETEMVRARRCQRGAFSWTPPAVQATLNLESADV